MACNASTLLQTAASNGYMGLDDRSIKIAVLELICEGGAGASATSAQVWSGVGAPTHTPGVANQIYTDTSTGQQWQWYSSGWHT